MPRGANISNQEEREPANHLCGFSSRCCARRESSGWWKAQQCVTREKKPLLSSAHDTVMNLALKLGMICVAAGKWQVFRPAWRRKRC